MIPNSKTIYRNPDLYDFWRSTWIYNLGHLSISRSEWSSIHLTFLVTSPYRTTSLHFGARPSEAFGGIADGTLPRPSGRAVLTDLIHAVAAVLKSAGDLFLLPPLNALNGLDHLHLGHGQICAPWWKVQDDSIKESRSRKPLKQFTPDIHLLHDCFFFANIMDDLIHTTSQNS
jgi:hypothetical protein